MKPLEYFLKPTQSRLFQILGKMYPGSIACQSRFLLVQGKAPVLLVAHLDTVHEEPVQTICTSQGGNILMSPQGIGGDDRCGVYALVKAHELADKKPWLLFTCDEEVGGKGARAFADAFNMGKLPKELEKLKLIIEIDRKGSGDAVYYDCVNENFEAYITSKGFKTAFGTFSDISIIAPELGVAAVNLSSGYYHAHTLHEYINRKHLEATIRKVGEIIAESVQKDFPRYEYVEGFCENYWGWDYDREIPRNLPSKYTETYDLLLDYFSQGELESYRKTYGNTVLPELYASVYGR